VALLGLWFFSAAPTASAAEPEATVVKNRLYAADGRVELQLNYSFGVANTLTATQGPMLDASYHLTESFAIDLMVGYFFGGPTDLAGQAQCPQAPASGGAANCVNGGTTSGLVSIFQSANAAGKTFSDIPNLWTLNGVNLQAGIRWEPIYGKLSLLTVLPVHFKWYLAIDGGVAQFSRDSLDACTSYNTTTNDCNSTGTYNPTAGTGSQTYDTLQETKFSWVASAATGFRFIFLRQGEINLGLREYVWGDSYRSAFIITPQGPAAPPGSSSITTSGGITASLFADLGLGWTF
jgi:outer membrane beta-barrel protein